MHRSKSGALISEMGQSLHIDKTGMSAQCPLCLPNNDHTELRRSATVLGDVRCIRASPRTMENKRADSTTISTGATSRIRAEMAAIARTNSRAE